MAVYTAIDDAGSFFNPVLYTGTGAILGVTGVGFQPDAVWIKQRNGTGNNVFFDSVRGATEYLIVNTSASNNTSYTNNLTAFDSDGFTLGADSSGEVNASAGPIYVSWNWKAGTTTGLSGGTITPSAYSINTTSGIGIYKYEGTGSAATIAHGLGVAPKMIIVKDLDNADGWMTYHEGLGSGSPGGAYLVLNTNAAESTGNTSKWNGTAPTDTVFSLGSAGDTNQSSTDFIAYVFADVKGYSKFGSYTGNGNADGTFVYTGFRPACVLLKNTTSSGMSWTIRGNGLNPFNPADGQIVPNENAAEDTGKTIDILSNGFKARTTDGGVNQSGDTLVYGAWAEAPFVNSSGVAGNAR